MNAVDSDHPVRIDLRGLIHLQADARALRLPTAARSRSRHSGQRRSPARGRGMALAEVRLYQPGDDIRAIDWRVTARRQEPHTKVYEEERERPVLLVCDLGPSLFFASTGAYKQVRCAQAAALLAWLALWGGDQIGGIVYSHDSIRVTRPARRRKTVLALLDNLARLQSGQPRAPAAITPVTLDQILLETRRIAHTGSRIFVLSDFLGVTPDSITQLRALARHNEVTAIRISDPLEHELPRRGRFAVAGTDGPLWFNAADPRLRSAYRERLRAHEDMLAQGFRSAGVHNHALSTADPAANVVRDMIRTGGRLR